MNKDNGANRWWENYLVRYLMPSIAGVAIVSWLAFIGGDEFKKLLLIGAQGELTSQTFILIFLYGNLFCYIASYPILVFHATRIVDFDEKGKWAGKLYDGYILSIFLFVFTLIGQFTDAHLTLSKILPFVIVSLFSLFQCLRIILSFQSIELKGLLKGKVSRLFAYAFALALRRGIVEELRITKQRTKETDEEDNDSFDEVERQKRSIWRKELIDTYRHMREHGNSAFIFLLEMILAANCMQVLRVYDGEPATLKLAMFGLLLGVWTVPALFVHFIGQHLEHRFSQYDNKVISE